MKRAYRLENLDTNVKKHFEQNVSKCLIRALTISLVIAAACAGVAFLLLASSTIAIVTFGAVGFISLNATFIMLVPSRASCKESHMLIMAAAKDPERIDDVKPGVCALKNDDGESYELNGVEQTAWKELVVPYLCKLHSKTLSDQKSVAGHVLTKSEMQQLRAQRDAVKEDEARIQKDRAQLDANRRDIAALQDRLVHEEQSLKQAREDIELQASSLQQAEELVISRLSEIEVAEAQMEQMREDLATQESVGESTPVDDTHLKRKEAELDALRRSLEEDKHVVERQKTELNQLKGELIRASGADDSIVELTPEDSLRMREQELEAQLNKLKAATSDLEERTRYVQDVEESLIDRMNAMSEREAHIEQGEVNAGLRVDI